MLQPAPVQPTYQRYLTPGQVGMLADETVWAADTRIVETAAGIGFGLAVSQGALSDRGCIIGGAAFVGVTRADPTLARADLSVPGTPSTLPLDTYPQYDNAGVLTMGDIWVNCYAAVTPATTVTFSATTGQLGVAGTTITHARWMTSASGSAGTPVLAVLRLGDISSR
jgi:hypothetical protein